MCNCIGNVLLNQLHSRGSFGILSLLSSILLRCLELYLLRKMSNVKRHCNLSNLDFTRNEEYALLEL